ncbi:MAG: hypothetical protein QM765_07965 [Myxococcales bacterium]
MTVESLPAFASVNRKVGMGTHPYLDLLPGAAQSPALSRIASDEVVRAKLLADAKVRVLPIPGYAFINVRMPCIELSWFYLKLGRARDLYLDLLHELTHLRQLSEGAELWDPKFDYVDRPTEIEGYAVAVEEGMRLGMSEDEVIAHLHNPWMSAAATARLRKSIDALLGRSPGT